MPDDDEIELERPDSWDGPAAAACFAGGWTMSDAVSPTTTTIAVSSADTARVNPLYPGEDVAPPQLGNGHEAVVRAEGDQTHEQAGLQQQQSAVRRLPEADQLRTSR